MTSYFRRPLPAGLVALDTPDGRALFAEALADGTAGAFFPLVAQLQTQGDPAWCGLGSLVTTLNALEIDPGRTWKGPWRHFSEELLICCKTVEVATVDGLALPEVECLARCNGANVQRVHAGPDDLQRFRAELAASAAGDGSFVVVNYLRSTLGQTGAGHFSPIGAVHRQGDLALILDVARFKYPPHWAPIESLFAAMRDVDAATAEPRGWLVLRKALAALGEPCTPTQPAPR
jgi:glutathione gamma-glutamylcysteinyltransferase